MTRGSFPPARALAIAGAFTALYMLLAATTLRDVGPSGDTTLAWAETVPHISVLCVQRQDPGLVLATDPDPDLRRRLRVPLVSNQATLGWDRLGAVLSNAPYNARLRVGPLDLPWMRNGYSSGVPDWLPRALAAGPGGWIAGQWSVVLLGAAVLLGTVLLAGRIGGPFAAFLAGCLLAAEPQFHYYRRNLAGTEVWLQGLSIAVAALAWSAGLRGSWRRLWFAALLGGLGLHVKLSFLAILVSLGLVALLLAAWRPLLRGRRWREAVALTVGALGLLAVGFAPTPAYHLARRVAEYKVADMEQGQATVEGAIRETRRRLGCWLPALRIPGAPDPPAREKSERGGKHQALAGALLLPGRGLRRGFAFRGEHSGPDAAGRGPHEVAEGPDLPAATWLAGAALATLLLLAIPSGLRHVRTAWARGPGGVDAPPAAAWASALIPVLPLVVRVMHPDPHNMAMIRPLLALCVGVGVAALLQPAPSPQATPRPRAGAFRATVVALALLVLAGNVADVATLGPAQDAAVGRLLQTSNQRALAEALLDLGAVHPAVVEHELMSVIEAHSGGRVRPVHYERSAFGQPYADCATHFEPRWLETVIAAHEGSFLVDAWGPVRLGGPTARQILPDEIEATALRLGLQVRTVRELRDGEGRWFATIRAIERAPGGEREP